MTLEEAIEKGIIKDTRQYNQSPCFHDYCVLDLETTGLSKRKDKIIEIGILKIRDNDIVDTYNQLVNPDTEISYFIENLTGITNEMLLEEPCFDDIKSDCLRFIGDDAIIGYNIGFDLGFLESHYGYRLPNESLDLLIYARRFYPEMPHHGLSDMVKALDLEKNAHRALADCYATNDLYGHIKKKFKEVR